MNPDLIKYFNSPKDAAEFGLLHTHSKTREKLLGVTRRHYKSEMEAKTWRLSLPSGMSQDAEAQARSMFAKMLSIKRP